MATYKANMDTVAGSTVYTVDERNLYGSDRLGMYTYPDMVYPVPAASTADFQPIWRGYHKYELKNHLGSVMTVVNGQKIASDANSDNTIDYYQANIEAAYDYTPSTTKESSVWIGVIRKSFEPNYTAGTSREANPLAPDFMWCMDSDGMEKYVSGHDTILFSNKL